MSINHHTALRHRQSAFHTGFTLVELLVFLGIFALTSAAFITVLLTVTRVQVRQSSVAEVSEQSQFLLQQIQYYIEKSSLIDVPQDTPTSTLKLWTGVSTQDPVSITLAGGIVYIQQTATGTLQALTSKKVTISNLAFTRHVNVPAHDSVSVAFTLTYNTSNIQQAFSEMLQTSIARVSAATFDSNIIPSSTATYNLGVSGQTWSSINQTVYFSGSNVGIGTPTPIDTLELNGNIYFDQVSTPASTTNRLYNVAGNLYWNGNAWSGSWITTSTGIYYSSGNVGIGTSNPAAMLDINQTGGTSGVNNALALRAGNSAAYFGNNQILFGYNSSQTYQHAIKTRHDSTSAAGNNIDFYLWNYGTDAAGTVGTKRVMTLSGNGDVGIGTASPGAMLEVNGNAMIDTGGSANHGMCWKSDGKTLGYCSTVLSATGTCTCN